MDKNGRPNDKKFQAILDKSYDDSYDDENDHHGDDHASVYKCMWQKLTKVNDLCEAGEIYIKCLMDKLLT